MRKHGATRRLTLLGGVGLLAGCESIGDTFDSLFGERKVPLRGERRPVLTVERPLGVEEGNQSPVTLPPPVLNADWPQAGGTIGHAPGHPALGLRLGEAWRVDIGTGAAYRRRLLAPPIVADGVVYAADAIGTVTAVTALDGRRRWSFDSRPEKDRDGALGAGLAFAGGSLYLATGLAEAMALDPADGKPRWRVELPAPARGALTVADGRVYVSTTENHLLALSVEDGRTLWTYRGQATVTMALGLPAPAVEGDVVVAGFGSGELAAIRASDGRALWSETLTSANGGGIADIAAITALPVIDRGRVFASSLGGITIALDLRSGRRLWERDVAAAETPWVAGDWCFLLTTNAELACLGRDDGRVRWMAALDRYKDEKRRRGPIQWAAPVLAGGRILVAGSNAQLVEIDPANGDIAGRVRLPDGVLLPPAIAGGVMYVLTEDARLAAIQGAG
ncbi:outer membrane protein assembly factor BamB family protein [Belnapia rosea]|uniref:WD-40 repeat-containing protein n=1 Tax=Belnapia rosea TaxID=938405 RepID=A0A1G6RQY0_9PROT|nr:PQQ-like beta-propeller repeat protein [Belnapia rosea]SDB74194.1 PQQ-like domain-containing protein [Belnapia rosea]SDD06803.1 WD-40 repeat-containing protein [Belnapia rosea]